MKIDEGIEMLEVRTEVMGKTAAIHPVLIHDSGFAVLVDTGYPGTLPALEQEVEKILPFDGITAIILTHQDIDHIGNLAAIVKGALPRKIMVLCHEEEKPFVEGRQAPHKLSLLEERAKDAPPERRAFLQSFVSGFASSYSAVDRTLSDGEELPFCGGMKVVYSPGHTIGHICLYFARSRLLVAGDALSCKDGVLDRTPSRNQYDLERYEESLRTLSRLEIDKVVCYHGGLCAAGAGARLRELVSLRSAENS